MDKESENDLFDIHCLEYSITSFYPEGL